MRALDWAEIAGYFNFRNFPAVCDTFDFGVLDWGFFGSVSAVLSVLLHEYLLDQHHQNAKNLRGP